MMATDSVNSVPETDDVTMVVDEVNDEPKVGTYIGQCKWFSDKLGYGFITIVNGDHKGKDIFVHHTGIKPLNSNYKTLKKGEYINLNIVNGENGLQGVDITGICGGSLMCDVIPFTRVTPPIGGPTPMQVTSSGSQSSSVQKPRPPPHHSQKLEINFHRNSVNGNGNGNGSGKSSYKEAVQQVADAELI